MVEKDGQYLAEMALSEVISKTMTLKPDFLKEFNSIQRFFLGSWCIRIDG